MKEPTFPPTFSQLISVGEQTGNLDEMFNSVSAYYEEEFDQSVLKILKENEIEVVVLAGFMRLLTPEFIESYRNKILNIHPSLLPLFPGAHAHRDAITHGAKISGCTAHFVDEGIDTGPIIMQRSVDIEDDETEETLSEKILPHEHEILPKVLQLLCSGKIIIHSRDVEILPD